MSTEQTHCGSIAPHPPHTDCPGVPLRPVPTYADRMAARIEAPVTAADVTRQRDELARLQELIQDIGEALGVPGSTSVEGHPAAARQLRAERDGARAAVVRRDGRIAELVAQYRTVERELATLRAELSRLYAGLAKRNVQSATANPVDAALAAIDRLMAKLARLDPAKVEGWIAERDELAGALAATEAERDTAVRERDEARRLADLRGRVAALDRAEAVAAGRVVTAVRAWAVPGSSVGTARQLEDALLDALEVFDAGDDTPPTTTPAELSVIRAAVAWRQRIQSHPNNWADDEDSALIEAVDALGNLAAPPPDPAEGDPIPDTAQPRRISPECSTSVPVMHEACDGCDDTCHAPAEREG